MVADLSTSVLIDLREQLGLPHFDHVHQLAENKGVADATQKFILHVSPSRRFILIVSSSVSPFMVSRNAERMRMARSLLRHDAQGAIELPLAEGEYEGRTYAVWRLRKPLSFNRVLGKIQRAIICPSVFHWINEVAVQTLHYHGSEELGTYVERLMAVPGLSDRAKQLATVYHRGFLTEEIAPLRVLQHGDFWIGNVLKAPNAPGFIVIDWPGATADGLPFFDLVKLALSINMTPKQFHSQLRRYSELISCNIAMALPYVVAGLGRLHAELEYFPEHRFLALCEQKIAALEAALKQSG